MNVQVFFNCPSCHVLLERHRMTHEGNKIIFADSCYQCGHRFVLTVDLEKETLIEKVIDEKDQGHAETS